MTDKGVGLFMNHEYIQAANALLKAKSEKFDNKFESIECHYYLARCLIILGESGEAKKEIHAILALHPDFILPSGSGDQLTQIFKEIRQEYPDTPFLGAPEIRCTVPDSASFRPFRSGLLYAIRTGLRG